MITREVLWGDALAVEMFRTSGGLKAAVEAIVTQVGPAVGTRNTFAKLMHVTDPADLSMKDKWRAWLLLVAVHEDPADWGIDDDVVPKSIKAEALKKDLRQMVRHQGLEPRTR